MRNFSWLLAEGDVTLKVGLEKDLTLLALKTGRDEQTVIRQPLESGSWNTEENSSL